MLDERNNYYDPFNAETNDDCEKINEKMNLEEFSKDSLLKTEEIASDDSFDPHTQDFHKIIESGDDTFEHIAKFNKENNVFPTQSSPSQNSLTSRSIESNTNCSVNLMETNQFDYDECKINELSPEELKEIKEVTERSSIVSKSNANTSHNEQFLNYRNSELVDFSKHSRSDHNFASHYQFSFKNTERGDQRKHKENIMTGKLR
jgi:hypothetical protein